MCNKCYIQKFYIYVQIFTQFIINTWGTVLSKLVDHYGLFSDFRAFYTKILIFTEFTVLTCYRSWAL